MFSISYPWHRTVCLAASGPVLLLALIACEHHESVSKYLTEALRFSVLGLASKDYCTGFVMSVTAWSNLKPRPHGIPFARNH